MSSLSIPMKSADAPYFLVLNCADALSELVKVRALVNQAESFRPKLGELIGFLAIYHEVRNELGKRLSSGLLSDAELTSVCEGLLSVENLRATLCALSLNCASQLSNNLPALVHEIEIEINSWVVKVSQSGTADIDEALKSASELVNEISCRFEKASQLDSILCDGRSLIVNNKFLSDSEHSIFKAAADLLAEAHSITSAKLTDLLMKSKKWSDDHASFSKDYENLTQLLSKAADDLDYVMATSTAACRQSLYEYYTQIAAWQAHVRIFLNRAAKISSRSAQALGEHSRLKQSYSDSQNLLMELRSKIVECEAKISDEEYANSVKFAQKRNFVAAILGTFGAGIGFVWLGGHAAMFAVAFFIVAISFLYIRLTRCINRYDEGDFWFISIVLLLGLCAVGVILIAGHSLLAWLFDSWSLIDWVPKWLAATIPHTLGEMGTLGYAVTMYGLIFRNFLPIRAKSITMQANQIALHTGNLENSGLESDAKQSTISDAGKLLPASSVLPPQVLIDAGFQPLPAPLTPHSDMPPPLPNLAGPSKATPKVRTRVADTSSLTTELNAQNATTISSRPEVESLNIPEFLRAEIPPQLLLRIRDRLKREYRGDPESQHSELESQIESYRALQEIVAKPPEGLNGQTMAKIVSRAQREYPLDLQMQLHEVDQQIEGHAVVEHFSDGTNYTELPSGILNKIVRRAKLEHANDFSLQAHEVQEQMSAYIKIAELRMLLPSDGNGKEIYTAIAGAEREYPDDYSMQIYKIDQRFDDGTNQ